MSLPQINQSRTGLNFWVLMNSCWFKALFSWCHLSPLVLSLFQLEIYTCFLEYDTSIYIYPVEFTFNVFELFGKVMFSFLKKFSVLRFIYWRFILLKIISVILVCILWGILPLPFITFLFLHCNLGMWLPFLLCVWCMNLGF